MRLEPFSVTVSRNGNLVITEPKPGTSRIDGPDSRKALAEYQFVRENVRKLGSMVFGRWVIPARNRNTFILTVTNGCKVWPVRGLPDVQ